MWIEKKGKTRNKILINWLGVNLARPLWLILGSEKANYQFIKCKSIEEWFNGLIPTKNMEILIRAIMRIKKLKKQKTRYII